MIFDTHCHIYDSAFDLDQKEVIQRALDNKVCLMMVPSDNLVNSHKSIELAEKYDFIYSSIGIHPSEVYSLDLDKTIEDLRELSKHEKVKAIGEIGLDYFYYKEENQKNMQKIWFKKQIELANEVHLPIIVHSRDACQDTLDILKEVKPMFGCVFHCYSYSKETLKEIIKRGFYIGLDGPVTFKNSIEPKEIAKMVSLNRLLIETDSPYLTPVPHRGKRNEPSEIIYIAQEIALLRNITFDELTKITYLNGKEFFSI